MFLHKGVIGAVPGIAAAREHIERVQSIAVANNDYAEGPGKIFSRARLDEGTLSLYLIRHLNPVDALRLRLGMLLGSWRSDQVLEIENVRSLVIRTNRRSVRAMLDGEIEMLHGPLSFRSLPLALKVLAPPVVAPEPTNAVEGI